MQLLFSRYCRPLATVIAVSGFLAAAPAVLQGAPLVFYTSWSSFNTAEPGLPVEGFSKANVASGSINLQSSPISSLTNDSIFSTGSMLPGLSISNLNPLNKPGLIVYGDGALFGGTKSVGTNWFGDPLVLSFAPGMSAVGADVFAATSPGQTLAGNFTADVYNGSTWLGSTTFSEAVSGFGFMGVSSTSPITSIDLLYVTDDASTFADNIAFGSQGVTTSPVPEPSTVGILALLGGLLAAARSFNSRRVDRN